MYLKFPESIRRDLFTKTKEKLNCTWLKLAKILKINRSMLFFYISGRYRIPYNILIKLEKLSGTKIPLSKAKVRYKEKKIIIPKKSKELVEFLGILAGDGHINDITYEMTISGHRKFDRIYIRNFIKPLIKKIFGLDPYIVEKENTIYCRLYSKQLVNFLNNKYGAPLGKKKGNLKVPPSFLNHRDMKHYLRGVFDTDGSINRYHQTSVSLEITNITPSFLSDLDKGLSFYGFHSNIRGKALSIYRKGEINRFFDIIKPRNPKHLNRYNIYNEIGYIPKEMRL